MSSRVKVAVRVRPFSKNEIESESVTECVAVNSPEKQLVIEKNNEQISFVFDNVYSDQVQQEAIFKDLGMEMIQSAFEGISCYITVKEQEATGIFSLEKEVQKILKKKKKKKKEKKKKKKGKKKKNKKKTT
jgi:hypothetical protein